MKAKVFLMAVIAGVALTAVVASADQSADQPVSIRNVKLLEEQVVKNATDNATSNSWERRERRERWERRERREGWWGRH